MRTTGKEEAKVNETSTVQYDLSPIFQHVHFDSIRAEIKTTIRRGENKMKKKESLCLSEVRRNDAMCMLVCVFNSIFQTEDSRDAEGPVNSSICLDTYVMQGRNWKVKNWTCRPPPNQVSGTAHPYL